MLLPDSSSFETLINYFSFAAWVFYGVTVSALIWLRYRKPEMKRPYKVSHVALIINYAKKLEVLDDWFLVLGQGGGARVIDREAWKRGSGGTKLGEREKRHTEGLGKNCYRSRKIMEIWNAIATQQTFGWKTIATEKIYQNKVCNDSPMHRFKGDICSNDMSIDISTRCGDITIQ